MTHLQVDVTQFARQPARSGIQRALGALAAAWPADVPALFFVREGGAAQGLPPASFADVVAQTFARRPGAEDSSIVHGAFAAGTTISDRSLAANPLLLPEPTYDNEILHDLEARLGSGRPVTLVVFDCFPQTAPWAFSGNGQVVTSRYFRLVAAARTAIATSDAVHDDLVRRLRRKPGVTPVVWLGVDGPSPSPATGAPDDATFLMIGTVEPRKRVLQAVKGIDFLRRAVPRARLVVAGRPGWEEPAVLRRLDALSSTGQWVRWLRDADDHELSRQLRSATALLSIGDEGFGLPVVEALRAGCPVAYAGRQPAASRVEGRGAWRIDASTPERLAEGLELWCDPETAAQRRAAIDVDGLPTWTEFAERVARLAVA